MGNFLHHTLSNNHQVRLLPHKSQTKQLPLQWNPSRTPPTTLVTRSTKPLLVLPRRPTRTLPRTLTHLSEPVPLPQRTPSVTRLMRARTPHLLRAISRLLPTKHLTQSPRPMISLCDST